MNYKVLIIDDEPWSREVVKALGKWEEFKLTIIGESNDGLEGMEMIGKLKPDIVITDMRMPGLDGVRFLKEVNEKYNKIKLIVMSGYNDFVYLKQAIRCRAIEYLLKPIDPKELNASLERCIKELKIEQQKPFSNLSTLQVFANSEIMDTYLDYRQRIYGFLMELNHAAVMDAFEKLEKFFVCRVGDSNIDVISKMGYDFILMLEEYISKNEITFKQIWANTDPKERVKGYWLTIHDVFDEISALYGDTIQAIITIRKNKSQLDVDEVVNYIERYFQDFISLESVAQHFYVSKEHLSRIFKIQKGETILDYITRMRMEKAKELIVDNQIAIKHVALLTGYRDIAYFYRVFKKYYGKTPGELRMQNETDINKVQ